MTQPTIIDLPHGLGREEARRRIASRIGELPGHIPGGVAQVTANWVGEDRMAVSVTALGQSVSGTVEVQERLVRLTLTLPGMLSFMAAPIKAAIEREGGALLLGDGRG